MSKPIIQAVPTRYAGVLFRSRLEARWAVFMDEVGQEWEYEPERISLPGGGTYLPDFITGEGGYLEIKGAEEALDKPYLIRAAAVLGNLSILGPVPHCRKGVPIRTALHAPGGHDVDHVRMLRAWFDYRPGSDQYAVQNDYWESTDPDHWLSPGVIEDRPCKGNCPYDAARGARFEHGESGAVR